MLDNIKLIVKNQTIINRLVGLEDFVLYKPNDNHYKYYYHSFKHKDYGAKFSLHFSKIIKDKQLIGYRHVYIILSPHYHYNGYFHNGNDFTPKNAIKSLTDILVYLNLEPHEYSELEVINIEFGLNIVPQKNIKDLIYGLSYYKKTMFQTPVSNLPYYKKTNATGYKQIKAYAKGLQFEDYPEYGIDRNTFRFEVKSKESNNIKKYGIYSVNDLVKLDVYNDLGQVLLNEWEHVLLININPDFRSLKQDEVQFIKDAKKIDFWHVLKDDNNRMKFARYKLRYLKLLGLKNNLHHQIKVLIIDKLKTLLSVTNSTSETTIKREFLGCKELPSVLINLEYVTPHQNNNTCLVTGLDISMQKKGSKFLCTTGIKYYKENDPKIYNWLVKEYLTEKSKLKSFDYQNYYIAHCIRNVITNKLHNRKKFENRNYNPSQLRIDFNL